MFYRGSNIIVLVYDVTRIMTFNNLLYDWLDQIVLKCDKNTVLMILGNKNDLDSDLVITRDYVSNKL